MAIHRARDLVVGLRTFLARLVDQQRSRPLVWSKNRVSHCWSGWRWDKGLGVFATEPIPKGHIVWRFISSQFKVFDEQAFGSALAEMTHDEAVYELTHTFGLRDFPTCVIRVLDEGVLINHSKNANLATNFDVPLRAGFDDSSQDLLQEAGLALREDRYALIALRDIETGEEFTNYYFEDEFDPPFYLRLYEQYAVEEHYLE